MQTAQRLLLASVITLLGVPTVSRAACPVGDPSVPFCEDFSGANPLASYSVGLEPSSAGPPQIIVSITNGALVFTNPLWAPLAWAHAISNNAIGYKNTRFEADLRFDTPTYLRSAMDLVWTTPALDVRIGFNLQLDEQYANLFVIAPNQPTVSVPVYLSFAPNQTYRLRLEIREVVGNIRPRVLAFKGYLDGVLKIAKTEEDLGVNLSALPAQLNPTFHGGTYTWAPISQIFDNAIVKSLDPIANAGADFSVDEGQLAMLDGSKSSYPDGTLTYGWTQVGGTPVVLSGATTATPSFTAPTVAVGGETLTFKLTVTGGGKSSTDQVSVTVVNVNHSPVADAGADQSIAEGSPVILHGENSYDSDNDPISYAWLQVGGSPAVSISGADTANPTFTAPFAGVGGAPGVVAELDFELTVDDGYGASARDMVKVYVTNVNNSPSADAGSDQTVNEHSLVTLTGAASGDPDSDPLIYAWTQVGGLTVTLSDATAQQPTFTAPFVSAGGADLTFALTVNDSYVDSAPDTVVVHVQNINDPPLASAARPTIDTLWPPNHAMVAVGIIGVTDPNNNATITITGVTQDEPTNGLGDGDTPVDAVINANGTVLLRAERSGNGDGRVYRISFTASDFEGSASGVVKVSVPHSVKKPAIEGAGVFDSTK